MKIGLIKLRDKPSNKHYAANFNSGAVISLLLSSFFGFFILLLAMTGRVESAPIWRSTEYLAHPLVGKIYDSKNKVFVEQYAVDRSMKTADILLLGETHSNADHHLGQAKLIARWQQQHANTALVFEMLTIDRWQQADRWTDRAVLSKHLQRYAKEWDWVIYTPITDLAVIKQLPILAANLSNKQLSHYARSEHCSLQREGIELLFCDAMTKKARNRLEGLIDRSHCGMLQAKHLPTLVKMQAAKDASFALRLWQAHETCLAPVLISGSVHVRKDIGVPVYLSQAGRSVRSIAFIEVSPELTEAADYDLNENDSSYDFIYFTPGSRSLDPCVEFKQQLKKMSHKQK